MFHPDQPSARRRRDLMLSAAAASLAGMAALLSGCATPPAPTAAPAAPAPAAAVKAAPVATGPRSNASTPREYRRDAAGHLYAQNQDRIFKGRMPPLLHAVGILQVEVDQDGKVLSTNWMRAPSHAPDVMAEIERTVRRAAPFPVPTRMGRVTYTDTWLWHKSGRFQLDTLTEGQD